MKAYVLHRVNELQFEEVETPKPGAGQVLIRVMAAGICGSDIPRIYQTGTYSFPLIPGHEFSGVVEEVGRNVSKSWIGKRVGVFPLIPCHTCEQCRKKNYEMCRKYSYLGSRTDGGFAEYVTVPEANLIEIPDAVTFEQAAMLEPMAVAVHAIRRSGITPDQSVAVLGLGTIGLLVCMFLKELGVQNMFVIGNKESQKKLVTDLGILPEHYCDSRTESVDTWLSEKTDFAGVDVFFEAVGKNETISSAILNTAPAGTVQLIGNPASDIQLKKDIYWKILRNQLDVQGSWNSSFLHNEVDDWHYVLRKLSEKKIEPEKFITRRFAFGELKQGLLIMRDKLEEYAKIMVVTQ